MTRHIDAPTPESWEQRWSVATPKMGSCETVVVDGIFWGLVEGSFSPLRLADGTPLWRAELPAAKQLPAGVAVDSQKVVVVLERSVVAFGRSDGALLWHQESAEAAEYCAPVVDGARVLTAHRGGIVARSSENGRELWMAPARDPGLFVQLEDRLVVPTRDALLILDSTTGDVVLRNEGPVGFALPIEAPEPSFVVGRDSLSFELVSREGRTLQRFSLASFLTDASRVWHGRRESLSLRRGATVSGERIFGGCYDLGRWFCIDLSGGGTPRLTREGQYRQYASFASSSTHVFASASSADEVDVFDHSLRWLGALPTGEEKPNFVTPGLIPTPGGLVVLSGRRVSCFAAPTGETKVNSLRVELKSPPPSPAVLAEVERLGGRVPSAVAGRVLSGPSGPLRLSTTLSTFLSIEWPGQVRYRGGVPRTNVAWERGELLEQGMASDFAGPLVALMTAERTQSRHAVAADDLTEDPLVFDIGHEGGTPLPLGTPLSAVLSGIVPVRP